MSRARVTLLAVLAVALAGGFSATGAHAARPGYGGGKIAAFAGGKLPVNKGGKSPAKDGKQGPKAAVRARSVSATALPLNGSFEGSLNGWAGYGATLSLMRPGADGAAAARVSVKPGVTSFSIYPAPAPVSATLAGTVYSASGWVRSQKPGRAVCLRVREWAGGSLAGSAQACTTASSDWKRFPSLSYKVLGNGHSLDVYAFQLKALSGDSFDVDAIGLADTSSPPPPPPAPPPPPPPAPSAPASGATATGIDSSHIRVDWAQVDGATAYRVLRGGLAVGTTSGQTFTDALLWPSTRYDYGVVALGADGSPLASMSASAATALLPSGGFPRPFGFGSVWNTPIGSAPLDQRSDAMSAYFAAHAVHPAVAMHSWGVSVAESHATDQSFDVPCVRFTRCTLGALGSMPIPVTAQPDPSSDGHLAVVDPASQREWDMWQGSNAGGTWTAGSGAAVSTSGDGVAPPNTESGNAANLPLLGGLLRPEELAQGHIDHALVFMMPGVSNLGHVCPATHNDGETSDPNALQEGMRIQLDPSVDVDSLQIPAWQKTIARALQTYGAYLRDDSGSLAILAEDSVSRGYDAWANIGLGGAGDPSLAGIPWSRVRVLASQAGC